MDKAEYVFYKLAQTPGSSSSGITKPTGNLNKSLLQSGKLSWKQHNLGRNAYMGYTGSRNSWPKDNSFPGFYGKGKISYDTTNQ